MGTIAALLKKADDAGITLSFKEGRIFLTGNREDPVIEDPIIEEEPYIPAPPSDTNIAPPQPGDWRHPKAPGFRSPFRRFKGGVK